MHPLSAVREAQGHFNGTRFPHSNTASIVVFHMSSLSRLSQIQPNAVHNSLSLRTKERGKEKTCESRHIQAPLCLCVVLFCLISGCLRDPDWDQFRRLASVQLYGSKNSFEALLYCVGRVCQPTAAPYGNMMCSKRVSSYTGFWLNLLFFTQKPCTELRGCKSNSF